jgi:hypothetical protein
MSTVIQQPNRHLDVTPTITTTAYTANDQVGGLITLQIATSQATSIELRSLQVCDKSTQAAALEFIFFSTTPAQTSVDNGTLSIPDASSTFFEGHVSVAAGDYKSLALNCFASVKNVGLKMTTDANGQLFCLVRTTGTPTYAVGDLTFKFAFDIKGRKD